LEQDSKKLEQLLKKKKKVKKHWKRPRSKTGEKGGRLSVAFQAASH
jgi:hypothetical protein